MMTNFFEIRNNAGQLLGGRDMDGNWLDADVDVPAVFIAEVSPELLEKIVGEARRLEVTNGEYLGRLKSREVDLAEALEELLDWQNGPPLITYEEGWTAAVEQAQALLYGKRLAEAATEE